MGRVEPAVDGRGAPPLDRDPRLDDRHPGPRPGRARAGPDGPGLGRASQARPTSTACARASLRHPAGAGHPHLPPQHRPAARRQAGFEIMARVAADENLHFLFYRDLATAALEVDPSGMVLAIERQVRDFEMPGTGIPDFGAHANAIAGGRHLRLRHPPRPDPGAGGAAPLAARVARGPDARGREEARARTVRQIRGSSGWRAGWPSARRADGRRRVVGVRRRLPDGRGTVRTGPVSRASPMPTRRTFLLGALSARSGDRVRQSGPAGSRPPPPGRRTGSGAAPAAATTTTTIVPPPGGASRLYPQRTPYRPPQVALTFHGSGDPALTDQMLALTAQLQAPITVFAVGQWLEQNPSHRGQDPGRAATSWPITPTPTRPCPSWARPPWPRRSSSAATSWSPSRGAPASYFRPSGVETRPSDLILAEAGKAGYATCVGFDVDPLDYTDPGPRAIVRRVAAGLKPGSIVSLHLGHAGTVAAFERIVSTVRSRGLSPALVRDVLP